MRLNLFLGLSLFIVITGCGNKTENQVSSDSFPINSSEQIGTYANKLEIDSQTPEGVGTLLSIHQESFEPKKIGACTWFLISKNKAMTNSHCISEELRKSRTPICSEYMQGKFKTKTGIVLAKCKRVIYLSDISQPTLVSNDYALIELDKNIENSATFKLDRKGLAENEKVKILTMNHKKGNSEASISSSFIEHNCIMKSSDVFGKISSPGSSPVVGFQEEGTTEHCKSIEGNSGSPVIDMSGRLVGILHGGVKEVPGIAKNKDFSHLTLNTAIITNLRCQKLNDGVSDSDLPETCPNEKKVNKLDKEAIVKSLQPKMTKLIEEAIAKQPDYFEYEIKLRPYASGSIVSVKPKCVKPLKQWKEVYRDQIYKEGTFSSDKKIKTTINQYVLNIKTPYDYYGNLKADVELLESGTIQLFISGIQNIESKKEVTSLLDTSAIGIDNQFKTKIPMCDGQNVAI